MKRAELIRAVEQSIGILAPIYRNGAHESDLYEASLLPICIAAATDAGGTVRLTYDGTSPASQLRFRRSPGNLWSGDFCYAQVEFADTPKMIEIHLGVYVVGRSKVAHECDVAILDHQEAQRSRLGFVHPRNAKLICAIEAKHYSSCPGLGVGRGFLGLAQELTSKKCSLAFPAKGSDTLSGLIAKKDSQAYAELLPGTGAAKRLQSHIDQSIRNWKQTL
ncbi:hypothetical protein ACWF82_24870 [Nocardia sp. NPDC055053]